MTAAEQAHSLINWWALAGVDDIVSDKAVNWFERDAKPEPVAATATIPLSRKAIASTTAGPPIVPHTDWPQDIDGLKADIAAGVLLPGNGFGGKPVMPLGKTGARLMIISDMPDRDELETGLLGSGSTGTLLIAMLAAIGMSLDDCYWSTLATTMPAIGELPDAELPALADFARHQMNMVQSESYLLLGSTACKALLDDDVMASRGCLRNFKHDDCKKAVLTTFHPRTLLMRPAMKAEAWKDLQMFAKKDDL